MANLVVSFSVMNYNDTQSQPMPQIPTLIQQRHRREHVTHHHREQRGLKSERRSGPVNGRLCDDSLSVAIYDWRCCQLL